MKTKGIIMVLAVILFACGGNDKQPPGTTAKAPKKEEKKERMSFEEAKANWQDIKGVGPIDNVELGEVDQQLAEEGKQIFELKCSACHQVEKEKIGPEMAGITDRRTPEWIMNMILNPEKMVKEDPIAYGLLAEYATMMANQNLKEEEARKILEYFRTI